MLMKSAVVLCLFALVQSASVQYRNIPVEVRYDVPSIERKGVRNLDEKVQLSEEELQETNDEKQTLFNAKRNLDEKVQLSPEEKNHASKHLPAQQADKNVEENLARKETKLLKKMAESPEIEQITQLPDASKLEMALQGAHKIVINSFKRIRNSFKPSEKHQMPSADQWADLENTVDKYFEEEKCKIPLKQNQPQRDQNFFQNFINGFQDITNNFVQNLQGSRNSTGQVAGQVGGFRPFQGFIDFFQRGVNNTLNTINNGTNVGSTISNMGINDTGTTTVTEVPGIFSNLVSNVQQFFGVQTTTQTTPLSTPGTVFIYIIQVNGSSNATENSKVIENIAQNIGSTIQNNPPFRPLASQQPAQSQQPPQPAITSLNPAQEDTAVNKVTLANTPPNVNQGTTPSAVSNPNIIQNIAQNIANAINSSPLNPFRPPTRQKPGQPAAMSSNVIQAAVPNVVGQNEPLVTVQVSSAEPQKKGVPNPIRRK